MGADADRPLALEHLDVEAELAPVDDLAQARPHGAARPVLRRLFDDRGEVERALADAPAPVADAAIADAARLVAAARAWADARRPGARPAAAISAR